MAKHSVTAVLPERVIEKSPLVITVRNGDGKAGELWISQGGLHWVAKHGKQPTSFTWEQFAKLMAAQ